MLDELKDHFGFIATIVRALPSARPADGKAVESQPAPIARNAEGMGKWGAIRSEEFATWR